MTYTMIFGCAVGMPAWSIWARRGSRHQAHQGAPTCMVWFAGVCMALLSPPAATILGPILHAISGRWALTQYLGHLCAVAACASVLYYALARLYPDEVFARKFAANVNRPAMLAAAVMATLFWASDVPRHNRRLNLFDVDSSDPWLAAYTVVYCLIYTYLLAYAARAFLTLRRAPHSRDLAIIYLVACAAGIAACVRRVEVLFAGARHGDDLILMALCAIGVGAFALGAAISARSEQARRSVSAGAESLTAVNRVGALGSRHRPPRQSPSAH